MIDILTYNDLLEIGENERDRMEFVLSAINEHKSSDVDKGYLLNGRFVHRGSAVVTHWMPLPVPPEEGK